MSSNTSKRYDASFRDEAVKLAQKIGPYQAARELGVSNSSMYKWINKASSLPAQTLSSTPPKPSENSNQLLEENKRLKKELARVKEEREILKKATSFFASLES